MAASPLDDSTGPLGIIVKVAGTAIADEIAVLSARTTHDLNRVPQAIVTLADGSVATNEFPLTDGADYKPGTEIEVQAHFGDGASQTLFKGIITATRLRVTGGGGQLELTCRDKAITLTEIRKTTSFVQSKDSDAMSKIIGDAGLSADVAATMADPADLVQYDVSDWDFLRLLADRNGHALLVDDGKVTSKEPDPSVGAAMTLTLGMDILEIDTQVNTASLFKESSVTGWDPAAQATVSETAQGVDKGSWGNSSFSDLTGVTSDRTHSATTPYAAGQVSMPDIAKARAARPPLAAMSGTCRYIGSTLANPGDTIELTGVGNRMGGTAFVSGINHDLSAGKWTTTARFGLPAGWRADSFGLATPGAGAMASPVHGLHVATVLAIVDSSGTNPMQDDAMIQISLPLIGAEPAELWARYAQPYASDGAGIQFLPEIGDEVIVGFLSADPGAPVILGSLHGGSLTRTNEATEKNELKTITTKSGIHLTFDDDKEILTAETPAGQSIVIDDDGSTITVTDVTGNTITMSDSGIVMDSQGTIDITAVQDINIESSGGDVNLTGLNIAADASVEFTGSGGATATLSGGGQAVVEGAMVMIN
ncbi:phage baseplate assembly protein V [Yoonia sediminilitoris]|uniref:Rhs element Vgr protein n=1 Tax=Yoonia sediminilitoris TaxID=1286148 RepID=A0A2T6KMD4_9RHOB|nr:phage baseplate assembly protein V [Yoonia sediminilitoris]PUB17382.1 Rhs element Vgr protein [Yoonia sediminilitoris]RCW97677.1 Rhs element Vgr protein [Yoonia sediminilitoris]